MLVALIWRVANPPKPPIPGPLGAMPNWDSTTKLGDMGPWAVSPSGELWAGAWNVRKDGKMRSAVWVIDLANRQANHCELDQGRYVSGLDWKDDKTVRVLTIDTDDPAEAEKSEMVLVDAAKCEAGAPTKLDEPVTRILGRSARTSASSGPAIAVQIARGRGRATVAVLNESDMKVIGAQCSTEVADSAHPGRVAAVDSATAKLVVFPMAAGQIGGNDSYYLADTRAGTVRPAFRAEDLPGRVEGMWVSPEAGVLMLVSERDKFHRMVYDLASGKLREVAPKTKLEVAKSWPDAPKSMMFVTYNAGYEVSLDTGVAKRLFDLGKLDKFNGFWREQVQDGRLYARKDGGYTSVSDIANSIDIRVIEKDGAKNEPLLPRR